MIPGEALTVWTVRLALVLYLVAVTGRMGGWTRPSWRQARWAWTLGFGALAAHVVAAFHTHHDWSHAAAYLDTARETQEVVGIRWGGGLYFNYVFTGIWCGDVVWWWRWEESYRRRAAWLDWSVHSFLFFMVFNATVVFETGALRWLGIAATAGLGWLSWRRRRQAR